MEQKTTQDSAWLLRVQAASAASRGLSPMLPIWVGVCARCQARPQSSSAAACTGVHTHTHTHTHTQPVARRATAGRQGDAGASSPWRGAAWGGHGCWHTRSSRHRVQPLHPSSARRGAHPPACSCPSLLSLIPASPAAAPAGFYGNSAGTHGFQQGQCRPGSPNPGSELPHQGVCLGDPCAWPCPLSPRHSPSPRGDSQGRGQGDGMLRARMALVAQCSGMGATARSAPQDGLGVLGLLPTGRLWPRQP